MKKLFILSILLFGCGDGDDSKTDEVRAEEGATITSTTGLEICPSGSVDAVAESDGDGGTSNDGIEELEQNLSCETVVVALDGSQVIIVSGNEVANIPEDAIFRRANMPDLYPTFCVEAGDYLICKDDQGDSSGCVAYESVSGWLYFCRGAA